MSELYTEKKILQFWSGGADSTYLFLQNLRTGNEITLTYVNIINNRTKVDREKTARNLLKEDIRIFCEYFNCKKPIFIADHSINIFGNSFGKCKAPQQIIFAMFSLLIGKGYDEIHLGVVLGDSMNGSTLNEDFANVYREHCAPSFPKILYPIENVSKETIYLTLQAYDNLLGTHFLEHITVCENEDEPCGDEKTCMPCITQERVFKKLKWLDKNHTNSCDKMQDQPEKQATSRNSDNGKSTTINDENGGKNYERNN